MMRSQPLILTNPGVTVSNEDADIVLPKYTKTTGQFSDKTFPAVAQKICAVVEKLHHDKPSFHDFPTDHRRAVRTDLFLTSAALGKLAKQGTSSPTRKRKPARSSTARRPTN